MNYNEIFAKIESLEKELQELKSIIEDSSEHIKFLPTKAQTTPENLPVKVFEEPTEIIDITSVSYDPEEFDIEDDILYKYLGESEEVNIPYGIKIIGDGAFENNQKIKKVNFPDTVTEIGEGAFFRCQNLVEVNNSRNVIKIGEDAFCICESLEEIDIDNVKEISDYAFYECKSLKRLRFCKNTELIGDDAFFGCSNLKISIPETCKYYNNVFGECENVLIREVIK